MFYDVDKYAEIRVKTNLSIERIKAISKEYIKTNCVIYDQNKITRVNLETLEYCRNFFYYDEPVWFVNLEQKIGNKKYFLIKEILISDRDGQVYESVVKPDDLNGNTFLTLKEVLYIAEDYRKNIVKKYNEIYSICNHDIIYKINYKDYDGNYFPAWIIPIECEKDKIFSDPNIYLTISDFSGEIISVLNCHGHEINIF